MLLYKEIGMENIINLEIEKINNHKKYQTQKKQTAFLYSNIIMYNSVNLKSNNEYIDFENDMKELKIVFERIEDNINLLNNLLEKLNCINSNYLNNSNKENLEETAELKKAIVEYNILAEKNEQEILEREQKIEEFFIHILTHINVNEINKKVKKKLKFTIANKKYKYKYKYKSKVENTHKKNNNKILRISEKENKVYLPYDILTVEEKLQNSSKYKTVDELIKAEYILPLDFFKNYAKSRFFEGYKLVRNKEKGSVIKAIKLGTELMFIYSLNPTVIAACENIDELDIYLDCLENDELENFHIFDIIYEIAPVLSENTSK